MAVIVLTSTSGSPGVTTTALGLALSWPRQVLLVDADRDASLAVPAGYLRGIDVRERNLTALAQAHREHLRLAPEILAMALPLVEDDQVQRRFLPGFTHPGSAGVFGPIWPDLAEALDELSRTGIDVIVDAGRLGPTGLPVALATHAQVVLVVTRCTLRSLGALSLHLPALQQQLETLPGHAECGLLLVGQGRPYTRAEIEAQFEVGCWGEIRHSPAEAAVLSEGEPAPRRFAEQPLVRSLRTLAVDLRARLDQRAAHLGGRRLRIGVAG